MVSTISNVKIFRLKSRAGAPKVQKLEDTPPGITESGAKSVQISPDQRWLAVVRSDDSIQLHRITESGDARNGPRFLPKIVHLKRLPRDPTRSNYQHGSLGTYNRSISRLAFSADSRILAVGDLSGFLDTWVLEGYEDLTQDVETGSQSARVLKTANDDDSDEESDDEDHAIIILGQHWIRNPVALLLIKLPASPLILSFRPSSTQSNTALTNGSLGVHPTRHTPHPHSHDLPNGEDRLLVFTAENQLYEFNVLTGKMSDWSRRNPPSSLPREFRDIRDRAMGVIWDMQEQTQRIWVYGAAWLWMFDLSKDLPDLDDRDGKTLITNGEDSIKQLKRKRPFERSDDESTARSKHDTGAGSKIAKSKLDLGIGLEVRKFEGEERANNRLIRFAPEQNLASDEENDLVLANENDSALVRLRKSAKERGQAEESYDEGELDVDGETSMPGMTRTARPSHWHTFKYRPILGIVPLASGTDDEAAVEEGEDGSDGIVPSGLEVALIERPLWDLDLPPQYHGNQEWDP